ncbi:hypothetical protein [Nonomuraea sp. NPDC001699]
MASAAVQTLLEEVGGAPAKHVELIFQPELVVRGSTGSGPLVRAHSGRVLDRWARCISNGFRVGGEPLIPAYLERLIER